MKNIYKKSLCYLALIVFFHTACAVDTPDRVYFWGAGNATPPTVYFTNGIISPGTDYNLLNYFSGDSVYNSTTGLIGTTNRVFALFRILWSLQHRADGDPIQYWVYSIRPSTTFYNAESSLTSAARAEQSSNPELAHRLEEMAQVIRSPNTEMWVTRGNIVPTQIESATLYQLVQNRLQVITTMQNPNYLTTSPAVNPNDLPLSGTAQDNLFYLNLGAFYALPGAFCQSFPPSATFMNISKNVNTCAKHTYDELKAKFKRNLTLISD